MSRLRPPPSDTANLAARVLNRPAQTEWVVLQVPADQDAELASELADELAADIEAIGGAAVVSIEVGDADALIAALRRPGDDIRVFSGLDAFSPQDWARLDLARSRLARAGCVVLVASAESVERLYRHAPNLASWIAAAVWSFDESGWGLSPEEREARLDALRTWSGLDDAEVVARAERGTLPGDPEYAEWLILLGRGDLVISRAP
ncbi:hypothetical protein [Haliangium sp.]|uniref:hypothetical protein n=1 Tax=Haliangium sp. TaxID=2663208 RepID=UPI003D131028